mmetsp:Transcript_8332/g.23629  ORF Transcript_8332/g.23629 Transcript_8332/m.23629 type:complete len:220 (-) Transcript_8332:111-770(-)
MDHLRNLTEFGLLHIGFSALVIHGSGKSLGHEHDNSWSKALAMALRKEMTGSRRQDWIFVRHQFLDVVRKGRKLVCNQGERALIGGEPVQGFSPGADGLARPYRGNPGFPSIASRRHVGVHVNGRHQLEGQRCTLDCRAGSARHRAQCAGHQPPSQAHTGGKEHHQEGNTHGRDSPLSLRGGPRRVSEPVGRRKPRSGYTRERAAEEQARRARVGPHYG